MGATRAPGPDAGSWQAEVERTRRVAGGLKEALAGLSEADLDRRMGSGSQGEMLALWIGHDAYHTGQIVLIRKRG